MRKVRIEGVYWWRDVIDEHSTGSVTYNHRPKDALSPSTHYFCLFLLCGHRSLSRFAFFFPSPLFVCRSHSSVFSIWRRGAPLPMLSLCFFAAATRGGFPCAYRDSVVFPLPSAGLSRVDILTPSFSMSSSPRFAVARSFRIVPHSFSARAVISVLLSAFALSLRLSLSLSFARPSTATATAAQAMAERACCQNALFSSYYYSSALSFSSLLHRLLSA